MVAKKKKSEFSQEFLERKELIDLQKRVDLLKHSQKMEELEFMRKTDLIRHEQELERGRIKSAEIRKTQQRKAHLQDLQNFAPRHQG